MKQSELFQLQNLFLWSGWAPVGDFLLSIQ
jgi:hypothetical protein